MAQDPLAGAGSEVLFNPTPVHDHVIPRPLEAGSIRARIDAMMVDNLRMFCNVVTPD